MPHTLSFRPLLPRPQASINVQRSWLLILTALIFIPFLDKAFHIDDPLFIWTAQHITIKPWDFYGFDINWYGYEASISTIAKNPPLFSYYLAVWGSAFGWSEVSLHLAGLIPSLLVVWGTFELARLWHAVPAFTVLAAICTPVFIMSGTSVMCDMAMVAFYVWAVYFWVRGLEEQRNGFLAVSALCVLGSGLTKYFGVSLIPLLATYALLSRVPAARWRSWLLVAVAGFVAYELWTKYLYGVGLLSDAAVYAKAARATEETGGRWGLLVGLAFAGGGCAILLFCAPLWLRWKGWLLGACGFLLVVAFIVLSSFHDFYPCDFKSLLWQIALWATTGMGLCYWTVKEAYCARRDPVAWLLLCWIGGTVFFAAYVNWTVSARNILPLVPAIGLLLGRRLAVFHRRWTEVYACLLPSLGLSLVVAYADYLWANYTRDDVAQLVVRPLANGAQGWFLGHWGGQYYFQKAGWLPLDNQSRGKSGDVLAVPAWGANVLPCAVEKTTVLGRTTPRTFIAVSTMTNGAGYYASIKDVGAVPFAFSKPLDQFYILAKVNQVLTH